MIVKECRFVFEQLMQVNIGNEGRRETNLVQREYC